MLRAENFDKDRARLIAEVEKEGKEMEAALALPVRIEKGEERGREDAISDLSCTSSLKEI